MARVTSRRNLVLVDLSLWQAVDDMALPEEKRKGYYDNKVALELYRSQSSLKEIEERTGLSKQSLYKLVERCLTRHLDGKHWGYRACVPGTRIGATPDPVRDREKIEAEDPRAGAMAAFFRVYPQIESALKLYLKTGRRRGLRHKERIRTALKLHVYFLSLCAEEGVPHTRFPYTSRTTGLSAVSRYFRSWELQQRQADKSGRQPHELGGVAPASRIYEAVEVDGHEIDYVCRINVSDPVTGAEHWVMITRFWIIIVVEIVSRAVLGYSVSYGHKNYTQFDFIRAIKNALLPWKPREISIPGVSYEPGEGLPSGVIPECAFACFDRLHIDNAKAHLSAAALDEVESKIGCVPVLGPLASPDSRPFVEGFNRVVEESGFHRLPGTVGSKTSSRDPAQDDGGDCPRLSGNQLLDFVDVMLARLMNRMVVAANGLTPLQFIEKQAKGGVQLIRYVPAEQRAHFDNYDVIANATVSSNEGVPTIRFKNGRYTGPNMTKEYIGSELLIKANSQDLRRISASVSRSGEKLGELLVERRFRFSAHSVATRREIRKLENQGVALKYTDDIIVAYTKHLEKEARRSKVDAARLERVRQELKSDYQTSKLVDEQEEEGLNLSMRSDMPAAAEKLEQDERLSALRESLKNRKPFRIGSS